MLSFKEFLLEKLIVYPQKAKKALFVIGGGGSGKDFAIKNFIDATSFVVYDVDSLKESLLKLSQKLDKFPELKNKNLSNPEDVKFIHEFVKSKKFDDKRLDALVNSQQNILFNVTGKNISQLKDIIKKLSLVGYEAKNINLVWVLVDYKQAAANNQKRARKVPTDILATTHRGAYDTMSKILFNNSLAEIGGRIDVIINDPSLTKMEKGIVKDFSYYNVKKQNQSINVPAQVKSLIKDLNPV